MNRINFSYFLVDLSPWPLTTSLSLFNFMLSLVYFFHHKTPLVNIFLYLSLFSLIISTIFWFYDIIVEATYSGHHTKNVVSNLNLGFYLFLLSEIIIFGTLFFSYFYNSLIPDVQIGSNFPPLGLTVFNYKTIPLLNTAVLLFSGITVTASQHYLFAKKLKSSIFYLILTIILGIFFFFLQIVEYYTALFDISDSVYGASFFLITGCHSLHMVIGIIFLFVSLCLLIKSLHTNEHMLCATYSAIYYHLVDALWLVVFSIIYIWGYNGS